MLLLQRSKPNHPSVVISRRVPYFRLKNKYSVSILFYSILRLERSQLPGYRAGLELKHSPLSAVETRESDPSIIILEEYRLVGVGSVLANLRLKIDQENYARKFMHIDTGLQFPVLGQYFLAKKDVENILNDYCGK